MNTLQILQSHTMLTPSCDESDMYQCSECNWYSYASAADIGLYDFLVHVAALIDLMHYESTIRPTLVITDEDGPIYEGTGHGG